MIRDINRLIFHPGCYACDRLLGRQERHVCFHCLSQMEETSFHLTPRENELYYRFAGKVPLAGATSLFFYDKAGRFQKLMQALKYQHSPQVGIFLGRYLGEMLDSSWGQAILPVPLHWSKEAKRGYNQAAMMGRGLSQAMGIPLMRGALSRKRRTQTQARKQGAARWKNVAGAFELKKEIPSPILLIDDVITTGSTLESCMRAMLDRQPELQIFVACLGMARRH